MCDQSTDGTYLPLRLSIGGRYKWLIEAAQKYIHENTTWQNGKKVYAEVTVIPKNK